MKNRELKKYIADQESEVDVLIIERAKEYGYDVNDPDDREEIYDINFPIEMDLEDSQNHAYDLGRLKTFQEIQMLLEKDNHYDDDYTLMTWPDVQELMEEEWFQQEAILVNTIAGIKEHGLSAYLIPNKKLYEVKDK